MQYLPEFFTIALIHLLAVASPGPDFAIILKQSINLGRKNAFATSAGIGAGILVHVAYSLIGIGIIIANTPSLITVLKLVAASYFLYIAWHGLRAKAPHVNSDGDLSNPEVTESLAKSFKTGFLINALNVKATLFFVALFSVVIHIDTPDSVRLVYGVYMAVATTLWFSSVSYLLSMRNIRRLLINKGYWVERIMGLVLAVIAFELLIDEFLR